MELINAETTIGKAPKMLKLLAKSDAKRIRLIVHEVEEEGLQLLESLDHRQKDLVADEDADNQLIEKIKRDVRSRKVQ